VKASGPEIVPYPAPNCSLRTRKDSEVFTADDSFLTTNEGIER